MVKDIQSINIRPAKIEDLPQVLTMLGDLAVFEGSPYATRATVEGLEQDLFGPRPRLSIVVAEIMGSQGMIMVGFISWFENYSSWEGRSGVHIGDLWTHPEYRHKGIGSHLMNHLLRLCEGLRVDLFVLRENAAARAFYERQGFECRAEWCLYRMEAHESATIR